MRTVPGRTDHVVVVGAGLAGLSATLHLLGAGRRVTVVERDPLPGGRMGLAEIDGYRMDTGPTVLTMPDLVAEPLAAVGRPLESVLDLVRLDPAYQARFADGSVLDVHTDGDRMEQAVREFAGPVEAAGYRRLRRWLTDLYRAEYDDFIDANFDSPLDLCTPQLARLVGLGAFGRLDRAVGRFLRDPRLRRVFSFQALYAGVQPRQALAVYGVIGYMDTVAGVYFPRGGMWQVPRRYAQVAAECGASFRYGAEVAELVRSGGRATGVRTADGELIPCDAVVLTPDLPVSYRLLGRTPRRPVPLRASPSAVVVHAGSTGSWADLGHHTISFGESWAGTFDEIVNKGRLMSDPSLLLTRPTATDPSLAPPGRELCYLLAPCPNLRTGRLDWDRIGPAYAEEMIQVIERRHLPGFGGSLEARQVHTPSHWADRGLLDGSPFSAAHTFAQTGPFRPGNLPRGLDNVVLAGAGTTPGVGIPTVLVSGKLAAARITGLGSRRAPGGSVPRSARARTGPTDTGPRTAPDTLPARGPIP
ncbi:MULTISPECIES: phytoene desaturase family protein [Actinoalloteichus]|uniref:phytoene desaturase family protein n=1 Tax=Actinoalloteichus TaxID=65496 RepID=UPI0009E06E26|nr:phytoene desaturase family protein [Actinoalloteichus caeruleus]